MIMLLNASIGDGKGVKTKIPSSEGILRNGRFRLIIRKLPVILYKVVENINRERWHSAACVKRI